MSFLTQKNIQKTWTVSTQKTIFDTENFWDSFMKIIYILLSLLLITSSYILAAATEEKKDEGEDCDRLQISAESLVKMDEEWRFNNIYPYELCKLNKPIHKDIIQYLQGIRDVTDKSARELVTESGNIFCRGYFGKCDENSFYHKFIKACNDARFKTVEAMQEKYQSEPINAEFIGYSFSNNCPSLVELYLKAYKETAIEEIVLNHLERIEESNYTYLKPAYEKMKALSVIWNSFVKIFGNIARSLEGLTPMVHI